MIFSKKIAIQGIKTICKSLATKYKDPELRTVLEDCTYLEVFSNVIFCTNQVLLIIFLIRDSSEKGTYLRELDTFRNFTVLMFSPELFQFYNHRSGSFALECCGKCKVCCSRVIPRDFLNVLSVSRMKEQEIISFINDVFNSFNSTFELMMRLVPFALSHF